MEAIVRRKSDQTSKWDAQGVQNLKSGASPDLKSADKIVHWDVATAN